MKVTLWAYTVTTPAVAEVMERQDTSTEAEHLTTAAGRLCYESFHRPNPATADDRDYIRSTVGTKDHWSIAEHGSASFLIEGVSRNLTHELVRHRHLSFSQRSQRFCDEGNAAVVVPPGLREDDGSGGIDSELQYQAAQEYEAIVEYLSKDKDLPRKQAREAARYALLAGTETKLVATGNHNAWFHVLAKRLAPGADAEIRELAQELLRQLKVLAPSVYEGM